MFAHLNAGDNTCIIHLNFTIIFENGNVSDYIFIQNEQGKRPVLSLFIFDSLWKLIERRNSNKYIQLIKV